MKMTDVKQVNLKEIIAPSFYKVHNSIKNKKYSEYWLKGGRGSTKSSFTAVEIILGMMKDKKANAVAIRRVEKYCRDSVYEQLCWAIDILGVDIYWRKSISPLKLTYIPTGQMILFRGMDKPKKIKSTKFRKGYCKYLWLEEVDEIDGIEPIRIVNQSLIRGGDEAIVFYTFNPPKSKNNWVNSEVTLTRFDRLVHHSTYLDVPSNWLGERFLIEAEHLKKVNSPAYEHEYLGEVTGTGGEIFNNVYIRQISDDEIAEFDRIRRGADWGYSIDPFAYIVGNYDAKRKTLYIFYEIFKVALSNTLAIEQMKNENKNNNLIICDSSEPKSIAECKQHGLNIKGAKKGPDSVAYGIKFLQDLEAIIIDDTRCPNTAREFLHYELERDANGNFKADYPDKNNHSIDAVRYMLSDDIKGGKLRTMDKTLLGL